MPRKTHPLKEGVRALAQKCPLKSKEDSSHGQSPRCVFVEDPHDPSAVGMAPGKRNERRAEERSTRKIDFGSFCIQ
jgi:hypothetical protein